MTASTPADKLPAGYTGPWIAHFSDGPCAAPDHSRYFAVGPVSQRIWMTPNPFPDAPSSYPRAPTFLLVGLDGWPPEQPWPGQIEYQLADVVPMAASDGEPVCYYKEVTHEHSPDPGVPSSG